MAPWRKETSTSRSATGSYGRIKPLEVEGQPAIVIPGMKGKVPSLHDRFHLDVTHGGAIPPKATMQFESVTLMADERMKWEKVAK